MNIVDSVVIFILTMFVLVGMYRGYVRSALNVLSYIVSFILTMLIYPLVAKLVFLNDTLVKNFRFYAEGTEKLANLESGNLQVSSLTRAQVTAIVEESVAKEAGGLRPPMDSKVLNNLTKLEFDGELATVGEYFNETIVQYAVNVLCFVAVFFIVKMILNILISMYDGSEAIPRLRQGDTVLGGVLGFVEGVLIFFVLFSVVPMIYNIMVIAPVEELLNDSVTGSIFINGNIIPMLIRSVV